MTRSVTGSPSRSEAVSQPLYRPTLNCGPALSLVPIWTGLALWTRTPFFQTWELAGRYPKILDDEVVGEAARNLIAHAQAMLKQIIDERWLTANAVIGLFPAARVNGDDIEIYADESRDRVLMTHHCLRQQMVKPEDRSNQSLADLIAPKESGARDYIGAFAVTGFDSAWTRFHEIAFSNDLWLLDPDTDHLIQMFPEPFWQDMTYLVGGLTVVEALAVVSLSVSYLVFGRARDGAPETARARSGAGD